MGVFRLGARADLSPPRGGAVPRRTPAHQRRREVHLRAGHRSEEPRAGASRRLPAGRKPGDPRRQDRAGGVPVPVRICPVGLGGSDPAPASVRKGGFPGVALQPRSDRLRPVPLRIVGARPAHRAGIEPGLLGWTAVHRCPGAADHTDAGDDAHGAARRRDRLRPADPGAVGRLHQGRGIHAPLRDRQLLVAVLLLHRVAGGRLEPVLLRPRGPPRHGPGPRPRGVRPRGPARPRAGVVLSVPSRHPATRSGEQAPAPRPAGRGGAPRSRRLAAGPEDRAADQERSAVPFHAPDLQRRRGPRSILPGRPGITAPPRDRHADREARLAVAVGPPQKGGLRGGPVGDGARR